MGITRADWEADWEAARRVGSTPEYDPPEVRSQADVHARAWSADQHHAAPHAATAPLFREPTATQRPLLMQKCVALASTPP